MKNYKNARSIDLIFSDKQHYFYVCYAFEEIEFKECSFLGRSLDGTLYTFIDQLLCSARQTLSPESETVNSESGTPKEDWYRLVAMGVFDEMTVDLTEKRNYFNYVHDYDSISQKKYLKVAGISS